MELIRGDLEALGIHQEVFTSERALVESGAVEKAVNTLEEKGLLYVGVLEPPKGKVPDDWEPRPQTLFRATQFGDDVDRPLRKSDGSWTYFASDIAYHFDKFRRGYPTMIDIWGADHGGHVKRMQAAVAAVTDGKGELDVKLCQLVRVFREGELVKASKRAGTFITLREVVEEVGKDVVRFIMLTRKNDAPLDFDLVKVTEQSRDNPVFYVQYAHARARSVMRHAGAEMPEVSLGAELLAKAQTARLTAPEELGLIKMLANWPRVVETSAQAHEPHRVAFYLYDLAAAFHGLWNKGKDNAALRFLVPGDAELTAARLALVQGLAFVIASGLAIFGVEPVEEMR
jgi:arginyl-tRNA synthetase